MSVEGGIATRGGGLSAPRVSISPPIGRGERGPASLRTSSAPRIPVSERGSNANVFQVRRTFGPNVDSPLHTNISPRLQKTGSTPEYRPIATQSPRMSQESRGTRSRVAEVSTQQGRRDVTIVRNIPAERIRYAFDRPAAIRSENVTSVVDRAFPNTRPFIVTETPVQQAFDGGRARHTTPDRIQAAATRPNVSDNLTQAQRDSVRIIDARPVNPTRFAPESTRPAPVNPDTRAPIITAEAVGHDVARIKAEIAQVGNHVPAEVVKMRTIEVISDPLPSAKEELVLRALPAEQPLTSGRMWSQEQRARERKKIDHDGTISSGWKRRVQGVPSPEAQVKKVVKEENNDGSSHLLVIAYVQELLRKKKQKKDESEKAKVARRVLKQQSVIGRVNPAAETGPSAALGLDAQPNQRLGLGTQPETAARIHMHQQLPEAVAAIVTPSMADQVLMQPVAGVSSETSPATAGTTIINRVRPYIHTIISQKKNSDEESRNMRFVFFKPALDKRIEQWKMAVSKIFPSYDSTSKVSLNKIAQQVEEPTFDEESPSSIRRRLRDRGNRVWRTDLLERKTLVNSNEAISYGSAVIRRIRPVDEKEAGQGVSKRDIFLAIPQDKEELAVA